MAILSQLPDIADIFETIDADMIIFDDSEVVHGLRYCSSSPQYIPSYDYLRVMMYCARTKQYDSNEVHTASHLRAIRIVTKVIIVICRSIPQKSPIAKSRSNVTICSEIGIRVIMFKIYANNRITEYLPT